MLSSETSSVSCAAAARSRPGRSSGKRVRTIFTQDQLDRLEKEFERQQYMVGTERSVVVGLHLRYGDALCHEWLQL